MAKEEVKDFDVDLDVENIPGHTFKLAGREWHVKGYAPPAAFLETDDANSRVMHFVRTLLVAAEREAFDALLKDPDAPIPFGQISAISNWIVEKVSDRPTESPDSSGNGAGRTEDGSKENSSSPVATGK